MNIVERHIFIMASKYKDENHNNILIIDVFNLPNNIAVVFYQKFSMVKNKLIKVVKILISRPILNKNMILMARMIDKKY